MCVHTYVAPGVGFETPDVLVISPATLPFFGKKISAISFASLSEM